MNMDDLGYLMPSPPMLPTLLDHLLHCPWGDPSERHPV